MIHTQNRSCHLLSVAIAMALGTSAAKAATITVTAGGDNGSQITCTLRQALDSANSDSSEGSSCSAGSGADTIVFASALANSTITLSGPLVVGSELTVTGSGQIIDADNESRVFDIDNFYNVTLSNLTLTHGNADFGAGMVVHSSNESPPDAVKRGKRGHRLVPSSVSVRGVVSLSNMKIVDNQSTYGGAGIEFDQSSSANITNSTISGNTSGGANPESAGGIVAYEAYNVTISNSVISGNHVTGSSSDSAGGLYSYFSAVVANNVTFTGNSASGTDYIAGAVSTASYLTGGAKYLRLNDCTLAGNTATGGSHSAGGVLVGYAGSSGTLFASNTIITGNTGAPNVLVLGTATFTPAASLLGTELQATYAGNGNRFTANALLGPLADNGGPTQTLALLPGSPAIDAGNNALIPGLITDQRGPGFARIANGTVDIGAFEVQRPAAPVGAVPTPALSSWAAAVFAGLLALFGARRRIRR